MKRRIWVSAVFFILALFGRYTSAQNADAKINELKSLADKAQASGDLMSQANYVGQLAYSYWNAGNSQAAIAAFEKMAEVSAQIKNTKGVAKANENIGLLYYDLDNTVLALKFLDKAIEGYKSINDPYDKGLAMLNAGIILYETKQSAQAVRYLEEAKEAGTAFPGKPLLTDSYKYLSKAYEDNGHKEDALKYYKLYMSGHRKESTDYINQVEGDLQSGKNALNQKTKELASQEKEIQQLETEKERIERQSEMRQQEIDLLRKDQEIKELKITEQEAKLELQRARQMGLIAFSAVVLLFSIVLFRLYKQKKKSNEELKKQNKLISEQTNELLSKEGDIQRQKDQLEEQYEELKKTNSKLIDSESSLARLNVTKDKFFSIVAHDLKSPLNSLTGYSKMLAGYADKMSLEEIKQTAGEFTESIADTLKYLDNLLTWSRTQMRQIENIPQYIELRPEIDGVFALYKKNAESKEVEIINTAFPQIKVHADPNYLNTVLRNLISNALKFTPKGGTITVRSRVTEDYVAVEVKDSGIGISDNALGKLFELGSKKSRLGTAGEKGTGLGLLLCKEFVEKSGGEIWVKSTESEGTSFFFSMPRVEPGLMGEKQDIDENGE